MLRPPLRHHPPWAYLQRALEVDTHNARRPAKRKRPRLPSPILNPLRNVVLAKPGSPPAAHAIDGLARLKSGKVTYPRFWLGLIQGECGRIEPLGPRNSPPARG